MKYTYDECALRAYDLSHQVADAIWDSHYWDDDVEVILAGLICTIAERVGELPATERQRLITAFKKDLVDDLMRGIAVRAERHAQRLAAQHLGGEV
jgi:hypothetical protein